MDIDFLLNTLNSFSTLTPAVRHILLNDLKEDQIRKRNTFEINDDSNQRTYFIKSGLAKVVYRYRDDTEKILQFLKEGDFLLPNLLKASGQAAKYKIQFIEDSILQSFSIGQLDSLDSMYSESNRIVRSIMEKLHIEVEQASSRYRLVSTHQRYQEFIKTQSHLLQRVSLKQIASYLNIRAETLSRLRANRFS